MSHLLRTLFFLKLSALSENDKILCWLTGRIDWYCPFEKLYDIYHYMRILHILSQTPDFTGSGKYIQAIMKCAAGKGHDNFLVAGIQGNFFLDSSIISPENTLFVRFKSKELCS